MTEKYMTIPEVRDYLFILADQHSMPELAELATQLYRRPPVRRAKPRRTGGREALYGEIRGYAAAQPDASYHEIANKFDTTIGRVSEAIAGKRG